MDAWFKRKHHLKLEFVYHPTHPPIGSRHVSPTCCPTSLLPRVQFVPCMPRAPALTYHPSHPIALHASQTVEDVLIKIYRKMYRNLGGQVPMAQRASPSTAHKGRLQSSNTSFLGWVQPSRVWLGG